MPFEQWELLVIDNSSQEPLVGRFDLNWHPHSRHVREEELGLTPARLRGIHEAAGELLVFIDDDNVLCSDYIEHAFGLSLERPEIGAFGASSAPEFEERPSHSVSRYLTYLAVDEIVQDYWANLPMWSRAFPFGAGLCVRRSVAMAYCQAIRTMPFRRRLGRIGQSLGSHEDFDMVMCAIDLGMGVGRFRRLSLTHLISKHRVSEDYIVRLVAEQRGSLPILDALRGRERSVYPLWVDLAKDCFHFLRGDRVDRKVLMATRRVRTRTNALLRATQLESPRGPSSEANLGLLR